MSRRRGLGYQSPSDPGHMATCHQCLGHRILLISVHGIVGRAPGHGRAGPRLFSGLVSVSSQELEASD